MKYCRKCETDKEEKEFYHDKKGRGKKRPECKSCHKDHVREDYYMSRFGMTISDYDDMFDAQYGECEICGIHQDDLDKRLAVDHSHINGQVRALLCIDCNRQLGRTTMNPIRVIQEMMYLDKYGV